jgi:hypothetical protein
VVGRPRRERLRRVAVVAVANTPVYVQPVVRRTPLAVFPVGTRFDILDEGESWVRVEWNDPRWGRRIGYVEKNRVRLMDESR